jgi:hypothetical protein
MDDTKGEHMSINEDLDCHMHLNDMTDWLGEPNREWINQSIATSRRAVEYGKAMMESEGEDLSWLCL